MALLASSCGPIRPRLGPVESFACYYGTGHEDELGRFGLVILEPAPYSPAQIQRIRESGSVVLGYLSIGETREAPPASAAAVPGTRTLAPHYLDRDGDGKADRNGPWGSYYVDPRTPSWRAHVLDEMLPALLDRKGVDGLFLDTLDTVELYPECRDGLVDLVRRIRERRPGVPLVVNRGFSVAAEIAGSIDGFVFESYSTRYDPPAGRARLLSADDLAWTEERLGNLRQLEREHGVQVLVLDYADPADDGVKRRAVARARAAGLTYSISQGKLDRLPIEGGPGARAGRRP